MSWRSKQNKRARKTHTHNETNESLPVAQKAIIENGLQNAFVNERKSKWQQNNT